MENNDVSAHVASCCFENITFWHICFTFCTLKHFAAGLDSNSGLKSITNSRPGCLLWHVLNFFKKCFLPRNGDLCISYFYLRSKMLLGTFFSSCWIICASCLFFYTQIHWQMHPPYIPLHYVIRLLCLVVYCTWTENQGVYIPFVT